MVGFQYLTDIDIPKNEKQLFKKVESFRINDEYLSKSIYYTKVESSFANVKERIEGFKDVDKFIENKNIVCKYIKNKNPSSSIKSRLFDKKHYI